MVHIKYGSHKSTLKLNKDSTIDQLKQRISQELNIPERDLGLTINGKSCPTQGILTLGQARIPNNCKVLVSTSSVAETIHGHANIANHSHSHANVANNSHSHDSTASDSAKTVETGDNTIDAQIDNVKASGLDISQTVKYLEDRAGQLGQHRGRGQETIQEVKSYKKTAAIQG